MTSGTEHIRGMAEVRYSILTIQFSRKIALLRSSVLHVAKYYRRSRRSPDRNKGMIVNGEGKE